MPRRADTVYDADWCGTAEMIDAVVSVTLLHVL